jgi:hypothetical protein
VERQTRRRAKRQCGGDPEKQETEKEAEEIQGEEAEEFQVTGPCRRVYHGARRSELAGVIMKAMKLGTSKKGPEASVQEDSAGATVMQLGPFLK